MAANGRSRPATPSHTEHRNTWSGGISSLVRHHLATRYDRLTVKQVHRDLLLDFADPGGIGDHHHRQLLASITGTLAPLSWRRLRGRRRGRPSASAVSAGPVPAVAGVRMSAMRSQAGCRVAVLSPWWPAPIAVNRAWASSSWAAIMFLTSPSAGCPQARPEIRTACGAAGRARAVPCPLMSADRDHAASANPARGAGYHALFRALVTLTQYIRLAPSPGQPICRPSRTQTAVLLRKRANINLGPRRSQGRRFGQL